MRTCTRRDLDIKVLVLFFLVLQFIVNVDTFILLVEGGPIDVRVLQCLLLILDLGPIVEIRIAHVRNLADPPTLNLGRDFVNGHNASGVRHVALATKFRQVAHTVGCL
jgi:hypothetical protein